MKYKGVKTGRFGGRDYIYSTIMVDSKQIGLGTHKDEKSAARAYDLYVLKNKLKRKTNFSWKRVENNVNL